MQKLLIGLTSLTIFILLIVVYFYLNQNNIVVQQHLVENIPKNFSQSFCVNADLNKTAMDFALKSGLTCFRTDIALNNKTENFVENITKNGGTYLGILDYQTVGAQPSANGCTSGCNWTLNTWNASVYNALPFS